MNDVRLIDANKLTYHSCGSEFCTDNAHGCGNCDSMEVSKREIDNAPTIEFNETIALDFTNITEEQKQELIKLLSKTRIQAIDKDVIWQNGYDTCLNDKSIRESNWIPVSERLPDKNGVYIVTEKRFSMDKSLSDKYDIIVEPVEYSNGKWWRADFYKIIAWQPLPEPYKEAEND